MKKFSMLFAVLLLVSGIASQVLAAAPFVPVFTTNNNFTVLDPDGTTVGGTNDILFTWDGTLKTAVAVSGQVANATIYTNCPFNDFTWKAHDVAVYGPGTYTVFASCAAKAPACATGTNPITFTVGPDEIGAHILIDWGTDATNKNIDVVNVWTKSSVFTPDTLWTGACGSNSASTMWDLMSRDDGTGKNGYPMVDGGLIGSRDNFNMMGLVINRAVDTSNNNFTMNEPTDFLAFGGTNDVRFTWDGTKKTSVAVSGQVSNATLTSPCPFFGNNWFAHDVAVYGPGTYTVYTTCPGGSPGCGVGVPYTFTVNAGEIGGHMLFNWGSVSGTTTCGLGNCDIDVVDIWKTGTYAQGVDSGVCTPVPMWTTACGANADTTIWDHMSYDWDNDCCNGAAMVDGPFGGYAANFNMMGKTPVQTAPEPILWYNTGSGQAFVQTTDGTAITGGTVIWTEPDTAWSIVGKGDFDGDGVQDYVWRNSSTGQVYLMFMTSPMVVKSGAVVWTEPDAAWKIVATGDLNGDGKTDLIWWNSSTGQVFGMLINGSSTPTGAVIWTEPDTNWKIVAAGDLNGDSKADLIWWNSSTGMVFGMLMNGTTVSSSAVIWTEPAVSDWRIVGTGDLDGDGKADLIWRSRTTGQVFGMLMNGLAISSSGVVYTEPDLNWEIVSIGNYTSDNKADLLWRNKTSGMTFLLPMNGLTPSGGSVLWTEPSSSWRIEGTTEWKNNVYGVGTVTP